MAIQGSTRVFPLRGLLEFLGTTGRTGRLVIQAPPQVGLVAVRAGRLVAVGVGRGDELPPLVTPADTTTLGEILIELVRLPPGRFAFHPDGVTGSVDGFAVPEALAVAAVLEQAADDGTGLPPTCHLALNAEPAFDRVTITEELWELLTAVGDGTTVAAAVATLGVGLATVRRRV